MRATANGFSNAARTEFLLRDQGTFLGLFWTLLNPVFLFATLYGLFSRSELTGGAHYPEFLLVGLTLWSFFSAGTLGVGGALSTRPQYLHGTLIPPSALVLASLGVNFLIVLIELIVMSALVHFVWGISLPTVLLIAAALTLMSPLVIVIGLLLQMASIYFTDAHRLWLLALRIGFFLTPIFYHPQEVPLGAALSLFNPLVPFLSFARGELMTPLDTSLLIAVTGIPVIITVALLVFLDKHRALLVEKL